LIPFSSTSISDKTEHLHALEQANTTSHRINHRTAWVEKDRNDHPGVEPHATGQSRQPLDQTAQSHIQPGFESNLKSTSEKMGKELKKNHTKKGEFLWLFSPKTSDNTSNPWADVPEGSW